MAQGWRDVWAKSQDGLRLHARVYEAPSREKDPRRPHAEVLGGPAEPAGEPRSTRDDGASFEASLREARQDEDVGSAQAAWRESDGRLPLVCLHGLSRNASEFHETALALLARGVADRIVAVDYRGRGLSDHDPDPAHYTVPVETGDVLAILGELGIEAAIFVGVSRGGLIAMGLGAYRQDLVRGIVLNDIGPVVERAGLLRLKSYVGRLAQPADMAAASAGLRTLFGRDFPNLTEAEWSDWASTVWTLDEGALRAAYDPALSRTLDAVDAEAPIPDLWPLWDMLKPIPMMVIRGGNSDLLSADTVSSMAARHPGLDVLEVPGEGHTPFMHRATVADRIAAFVATVNADQRPPMRSSPPM